MAGDAGGSFVLRLKPGADLRRSLDRFARKHRLRAAYVGTCVGSLRCAAIRFADKPKAGIIEGPFEIVSLVGTLSTRGLHLHISVSDGKGKTIGGHLGEGSIVHTTAEIVIVSVSGVRFAREPDPTTGYRELVVRRRGQVNKLN